MFSTKNYLLLISLYFSFQSMLVAAELAPHKNMIGEWHISDRLPPMVITDKHILFADKKMVVVQKHAGYIEAQAVDNPSNQLRIIAGPGPVAWLWHTEQWMTYKAIRMDEFPESLLGSWKQTIMPGQKPADNIDISKNAIKGIFDANNPARILRLQETQYQIMSENKTVTLERVTNDCWALHYNSQPYSLIYKTTINDCNHEKNLPTKGIRYLYINHGDAIRFDNGTAAFMDDGHPDYLPMGKLVYKDHVNATVPYFNDIFTLFFTAANSGWISTQPGTQQRFELSLDAPPKKSIGTWNVISPWHIEDSRYTIDEKTFSVLEGFSMRTGVEHRNKYNSAVLRLSDHTETLKGNAKRGPKIAFHLYDGVMMAENSDGIKILYQQLPEWFNAYSIYDQACKASEKTLSNTEKQSEDLFSQFMRWMVWYGFNEGDIEQLYHLIDARTLGPEATYKKVVSNAINDGHDSWSCPTLSEFLVSASKE